MAVDKIQIEELLGSGLSNEVVAAAVGCDPSYITQLLSDEDFHNAVVQRRTKNLQRFSERDLKLDTIEDFIVEKIESALPMMYKPNELLRAFQILNAAKRRGPQSGASSTMTNQTVVNIRLPEAIRQKYVVNGNGEVIGVDDQTLVTMSSRNVLENLRNMSTKKKELNYVPVPVEAESSA